MRRASRAVAPLAGALSLARPPHALGVWFRASWRRERAESGGESGSRTRHPLSGAPRKPQRQLHCCVAPRSRVGGWASGAGKSPPNARHSRIPQPQRRIRGAPRCLVATTAKQDSSRSAYATGSGPLAAGGARAATRARPHARHAARESEASPPGLRVPSAPPAKRPPPTLTVSCQSKPSLAAPSGRYERRVRARRLSAEQCHAHVVWRFFERRGAWRGAVRGGVTMCIQPLRGLIAGACGARAAL